MNIRVPDIVYTLRVDSLQRRTHTIFALKHTLLHVYFFFLFSQLASTPFQKILDISHEGKTREINKSKFKFLNGKMPIQLLQCYNSLQKQRCGHILEGTCQAKVAVSGGRCSYRRSLRSRSLLRRRNTMIGSSNVLRLPLPVRQRVSQRADVSYTMDKNGELPVTHVI